MNVFEQARNSGENVYEVTVRFSKPRGMICTCTVVAKTSTDAMRKVLRRAFCNRDDEVVRSTHARKMKASEWL